jgi:hypothetical protein
MSLPIGETFSLVQDPIQRTLRRSCKKWSSNLENSIEQKYKYKHQIRPQRRIVYLIETIKTHNKNSNPYLLKYNVHGNTEVAQLAIKWWRISTFLVTTGQHLRHKSVTRTNVNYSFIRYIFASCCTELRWPNNKTTQSRLNRNTQRSHIQNNKERTIHTWNLRLTQSTALQQQQQPYPVTPEDGQLGRNM